MLAIDYSFWRPDPTLVKSAGYDAILRYFSHDLSKSLTQAEIEAAHRIGLGVGAVFEDSAQRALGGAAAGRADGIYANAYADSIGWPTWKPIGYAIDFAPTPEQIPTVIAYVQAAGQQGRVAYGYGDSDVIDALVAAGVPDDWQTCAGSRGVVNNKAAIYQRLRPTTSLQGSFDEDVILHPSNDLWFPGDTAPARPAAPWNPAPPAIQEPEDMRPWLFQDSTGIYALLGDGSVHVPTMDDVNALGGAPVVTKVSDSFGASIRAKG